MYRLIYFSQEEGYGVFNSDTYRDILNYHFDKEMTGKEVVCIVSYKHACFLYKSINFDLHSDAVDSQIFDDYIESSHEVIYDFT